MSENCNRTCARCVDIISWIGLFDSVALALIKGLVGILTRSHALTASALYSIHDVVSGAAVLIGMRISEKPADDDHPYGHGNAEYIICTFMSILIMGATIFLVADAARSLLKSDHVPPHWAALVAAAISVFANEAIYRFNLCGQKQIHSPVILAHGKHHRADAISSLAALVAIIGGMLGYRYLDALVAVFEAGHLIIVSAEILHQGGSGLIDRAITDNEISSIRCTVSDIPAVQSIRDIKTRQIGRRVWVDLYVALPGDRTIAEVNTISGQIRHLLGKNIKHLGHVNVICV